MSCSVAKPRSSRTLPIVRRTVARANPCRPSGALARRRAAATPSPASMTPPAITTPRCSLPRRARAASASRPLRRAYPRGDPLPSLEHAWLADEDGVEHAERLADLRAASLRQRFPLIAVHLRSPLRQRADRAVPDVLPDLCDVFIQPWRLEQERHRLGGGRGAGELRPDGLDVPG